jgi:hypothetical protein
MMLCDPVTGKAEVFGMDGKVGCVGERGGDIATFNDGDEVKQGEFGHTA